MLRTTRTGAAAACCQRFMASLAALTLGAAVPTSTLAQAAPPASDTVQFITLGTGGGPVIRRERSEPANAVKVGQSIYLFDIGAGTLRRMAEAGLATGQIKAIFLSHLHIDHTADLAPFLLNRWVLNDYRKLPVFGPRGTAATVGGIAQMSVPVRLAPVTIGGPRKPSFESTHVVSQFTSTMDHPTLIYFDEKLRVLAITNSHYNFAPGSAEARFSRSYAFRIEAGGKSYVYTGDTGMSDKLVELAHGADVLVSEVIDMAGIAETLNVSGTVPPNVLPALLAHMEHDHLTPTQIGEIARRAGVKRVVLTHLVPGNDGETELTPYTRGLTERFAGPVVVAKDLDSF